MRRKYAQPALPTLYFREGVLSVPGYTFDRVSISLPLSVSHFLMALCSKASQWEDTGSMTLLAEGISLKDGSNVLAKIAPAHSNASMCIEREAHMFVHPFSFLSLSNTSSLSTSQPRTPF